MAPPPLAATSAEGDPRAVRLASPPSASSSAGSPGGVISLPLPAASSPGAARLGSPSTSAASLLPSTSPVIASLNPRQVSNSYDAAPYQAKLRPHPPQPQSQASELRTPPTRDPPPVSSGWEKVAAAADAHASAALPAAALTQELPFGRSLTPQLYTTHLDSASASTSERAATHQQLQQEVLRLQAENASVKDEVLALRQRLKAIEEHNVPIPPTVGGRGSHFTDVSSGGHIHTEQLALAAWQQSQALDIPLPLLQHVGSFDAEPFLRSTHGVIVSPGGASLQEDVANLLNYLKPSKRSESRRANVLSFLKLLVRKALGAQVYALGAYALKTYVGQDEVMDVSAYFSRAHEHTWLHRIVNALCQEASSNHHNSTSVHATNTASPHYAVSKLSVSFNKSTPYINCCIGGIHVNVYGNHVAGLSSLALFERMDLLCSSEHLFKRTILLVKCWCAAKKILNCAASTITPSSSGDDLFSHTPIEGLLSGMFIRTLVLYIFNAQGGQISTPLEGLYRLLAFLKDFEWEEHALTIYGAVTLASLEQYGAQHPAKWEYVSTGPTAWPVNSKPVLPRDTWKQFLLTPKDTQTKPNQPNATSTMLPKGASTQTTSRASNSSSPGGVSSSFTSAARSISDSHLTTLPLRAGMVGPSSSHQNLIQASASPQRKSGPISATAHSFFQAAHPMSSHSQSFTSLDSLVLLPTSAGANAMRQSAHSHSFSNLKQFSSPAMHQHQQSRRGLQEGEYAQYSPSDESALTPSDSTSLTPSHSQVDMQKLLGVGGGASLSNNRLGFGGALSTVAPLQPLRSSSSVKQLTRLPQPVAGASSFFSSHTLDDGLSETDSPDFFDDDETHGRLRHTGSYDSLDGDEALEGAEYLDLGAVTLADHPSTAADEESFVESETTPSQSPVPGGHPNEPLMFTRCSLNVLDPVDPSHNLGASISYKHEYHVRSVLRDGFWALKNSLQKYAFQQAAKAEAAKSGAAEPEDALSASDRMVAELEVHPVVLELFEEGQLSQYKELLHRDQRHRKLTAGSSVAASTVQHSAASSAPNSLASTTSSVHLASVHSHENVASLWATPSAHPHGPASSLDQVFQHASPAFTASAFSTSSSATDLAHSASHGSLFAFDGLSSPAQFGKQQQAQAVSPPRTGDRVIGSQSTSFALNPNSTHFVPNGVATGPVIVDDMISSTSTAPLSAHATVDATVAAPSASTAPLFDTLSGDIDKIVANLDHARQFETPDLTEDQLVHLIIDLLKERVSVPVGRMGSLLHDATNNHSLPAMLKESYGGLKRLLERHVDLFQVGRDHPYNPNVSLKPKWFHFAPPRPNSNATNNGAHAQHGQHAQGARGGAGSQAAGSSNGNCSPDGHGQMTRNGSSGNLQAMMLQGADGNRRKLQRRRTRTRRTNSGASGSASAAAAQSVRGSLLADPHHAQQQSSPSHLSSVGVSSIVPHPRAQVTPIIALDCEMVGVGSSGFTSMLARISIVNFAGEVLYDKFVLPTEPVTDYRTHTSGIHAHQLEGGIEFHQAQREVSQIIKHRVMVGHGLMSDLQALCIAMPAHQLRDTALFKLFCPHRPLSLKQLVQQHLAPTQPEWKQFQEYSHHPVQDARAALALYKLVQSEWEQAVLQESRSQQLGAHHSQSQPLISAMAAGSTRDHQPQYQSAALLHLTHQQQQQQQLLAQQQQAIAQLQMNQQQQQQQQNLHPQHRRPQPSPSDSVPLRYSSAPSPYSHHTHYDQPHSQHERRPRDYMNHPPTHHQPTIYT